MVELLELLEAGLVFTTVAIAAVAVPVQVLTDTKLPDIAPLVEPVQEPQDKKEND